MKHRRSFLKNLAAGTFGAFPFLSSFRYLSRKMVGETPVVISTWDFGKAANAAAFEILVNGGAALDAVEKGVQVPEADPENQTVGLGGFPDREGRVTLDACIMDHALNCGSVACLEDILHPISVARKVMEKTPHVMLVGEGALRFALAEGFPRTNLLTPASEKAWKEWLKKSNYEPMINIENRKNDLNPEQLPGGPYNHDTIGMLALDASGRMAGACTTSGAAWKMRGRVGDSPIIGAGLYVDNEVGAATSSGLGEEVIRTCGSHLVVELMRQGNDPEEACRKAVERIVKRDPEKARRLQVGFLALNNAGAYGAFAIHPGFTYSVQHSSLQTTISAESWFK